MVALISLGIVSLMELMLWLSPVWRWRKALACLLIVGLSVSSGAVFGAHFSFWAGLVLILSLYRVINLLRLIEGRTQADYLFGVARGTSYWLIGLQILALMIAALGHVTKVQPMTWLYVLVGVELVLAVVLLASTIRHLRTTKPPSLKQAYADRDLPTLTIAIPARNETTELEACLQSLLEADYPKLEVLVLDDCSRDKRTPEIIRGFASNGVTFIAGKAPPGHWLAKNYAYKQLADEANGGLLLFCGVDVRFQRGSLRALVETLLAKKKSMLSLIPRNQLPGPWQFGSLLVQPTRYAWELALPRRWLQRPPVLSTCWLITSEALQAAGGFQAVAHSTSIESYFARKTASKQDGYSFLQSDGTIGLSSAKDFSEQRATAIRTRYPQVHRRPELVGLLTVAELAALVGPFGLVLGGILAQTWLLLLTSVLVCVLLVIFYARIVTLTYRRFQLRSLWLLPFATLYDVGLLNYSMWRYEFREVIWKGRDVCIPVMRTVAQLANDT